MDNYKRILLAADLIQADDNAVLERCKEVASKSGAEITLVHVVEPIYAYGSAWQPMVLDQWQEELQNTASEKLEELGRILNVPKERQILKFGAPREEIVHTAIAEDADLIIIGNHRRHGLSLLFLGSTTNGVMANAKCDVLCVDVSRSAPTQVSEALAEPATV
jgi:universal stress protein A